MEDRGATSAPITVTIIAAIGLVALVTVYSSGGFPFHTEVWLLGAGLFIAIGAVAIVKLLKGRVGTPEKGGESQEEEDEPAPSRPSGKPAAPSDLGATIKRGKVVAVERSGGRHMLYAKLSGITAITSFLLCISFGILDIGSNSPRGIEGQFVELGPSYYLGLIFFVTTIIFIISAMGLYTIAARRRKSYPESRNIYAR